MQEDGRENCKHSYGHVSGTIFYALSLERSYSNVAIQNDLFIDTSHETSMKPINLKAFD
jgi:hypothetical protein